MASPSNAGEAIAFPVQNPDQAALRIGAGCQLAHRHKYQAMLSCGRLEHFLIFFSQSHTHQQPATGLGVAEQQPVNVRQTGYGLANDRRRRRRGSMAQ